MQTTGTRRLHAQPNTLHQVLDSAAKLQGCLPKCDSFTGSIADGYDFAMSHSIGPLTVTFRGRATFARAAIGQGYVLDIVGSSRMTGQISARVTLALTPRPQATLMDYEGTLDPSVVVKMFGAERVERAFAAGIGAFADRLKAAAELPQP
jgi:uncharacterized protein